MDLGLAGKTAVVTGGSAGIGRACAAALCTEGVSVLIVARDDAKLAAAAEAIRAMSDASEVVPMSADLREPEAARRVTQAALDRWGRIDILINNAGAARAGAFLDLPDEAFLDAWNLKLLGYIRMVRAAIPSMIAQRDGRIVNVAGAAGRTPGPATLPVGTTNAALLNFTRGIARELAPHNVRINAISPGFTATERIHRLAEQTALAAGKSMEEARAEMTRAIPRGHLAAPEEIAAMALLLVSDRVPSITGGEILIDGGQTPGV